MVEIFLCEAYNRLGEPLVIFELRGNFILHGEHCFWLSVRAEGH